MDILNSISLFFIMITLALIPSASVALVIARSITAGLANGISVAFGIVLGDIFFIILAIFGLSVIAELMGGLFFIIKYIGASYLIWMGITLLRSNGARTIDTSRTEKTGSLVTSFLAGFFLTLGDIKAIFFYASLFPAFIDLGNLTVVDTGIVMLITILSVGGAKIFYALSAMKVVSLSKNFKVHHGIQKSAGIVMIGTGTYLIAKT